MNKQHQQLIEAWLDNSLSGSERNRFDELLESDPDFQSMVTAASKLLVDAQSFETVPVPEWDRAGAFARTQQSYVQLPRWLTYGAIAVSLIAVSLSVVSITYVKSLNLNTVTAEVVEQGSIQAEDLAHTDAYMTLLSRLQQQQQQANAQLVDYVLTSSRQSREHDMKLLLEHLQKQRQADIEYLDSKIISAQYRNY
ncbi:hypothetical protein QWI17_12470 [Gilvimarinus sp. SDUM040013]|uniref:Anti-sigma factor n=1 Tax=Gilvimarinus gilvus TaxID=3058038 RepID=A0ABU4RX35_9GAMM|nr:hypothetical protein [Gilvimarinus sp. SDUM040013]MDO3386653.1 hypothetical protein [Gilvimarinus sp. SDUM040013]MDX6849460.1 hypothetical protein [Gilvimarinus sp. SDUM040013]